MFRLTILSLLLLAVGGVTGAATREVRSAGPVCPASISFGETIKCAVGSPGEVDAYTFGGDAGDTVLVRVISTDGTLGARLRVIRPDSTIEDDADGSNCDDTAFPGNRTEIPDCTLGSTGTYTILVNEGWSATGTGGYNLYLQRTNNPVGATAIAFGQTLSASLSIPGDGDAYTFGGNAGDTVLVRVTTTDGTLGARLRVVRPDGTLEDAADGLCIEDSFPSNRTEIPDCTLSSTGTYTILVNEGWSVTGTGAYNLYLQRTNNPVGATAIAFGQTLSNSLLLPGEGDAFTFSATSGTIVVVHETPTDGSLGARLRIFRPDGTMEDDADGAVCDADSFPGSAAEIANCTLSSSGTYTILVNEGWSVTATGTYTLCLRLAAGGCSAPEPVGTPTPSQTPTLTTPKLSIGSLSLDVGQSGTVDLQLLNIPPAALEGAWTVDVSYDDNTLSPINCTSAISVCNTAFGPNLVRVTGAISPLNSQTSLTLASLEFSCDAPGSHTLELHVEIVALTFELGNPQNVDPTLNVGEVSCAGATPTRTPTRTATRTATPASTCTLWGDVNDDGRVNAIDATYLLQYVAQLLASLPCPDKADVNQDGRINAIDSTILLQYSAGLLHNLPA